jgi:hypothetical protein
MSDLHLFGTDLFGDPVRPQPKNTLSGRFTVPPFSVLNTRDGAWQERKRAWLSYGIRSEEGRDAAAITTGHLNDAKYRRGTYAAPNGTRRTAEQNGCFLGQTSVFDPVLTELCYTWFCPPGGQVVDPFAGGSVRGIVASLLGYRYWGGELRPEQVEANREQAAGICEADNAPIWKTGDSAETVPALAPECDFVFSCPPYGNLEVYSDDPADISNMEYDQFLVAYRRIIAHSCAKLRDDRFAAFVVGDFRDKRTGHYQGFVGDTVQAFADAGLDLYNHAILVNSAGSLPIRVTKQFDSGRKMGKCHQDVLVFVKGSWRAATQAVLGQDHL